MPPTSGAGVCGYGTAGQWAEHDERRHMAADSWLGDPSRVGPMDGPLSTMGFTHGYPKGSPFGGKNRKLHGEGISGRPLAVRYPGGRCYGQDLWHTIRLPEGEYPWDRGRNSRLPGRSPLRTVRAVLPHTALRSVVYRRAD